MRTLTAVVRPMGSGFGVAGKYLAHVAPLLIERTGLPSLVPGTLNLSLTEPYVVPADAMIQPVEYNGMESIKLHRCVVRGVRAVIMRPWSSPGFVDGE